MGMEEYVASKKRFEKHQIKGLKSFFSWNKYPSKDEVADLSRELDLTVKSVNGWVTNQSAALMLGRARRRVLVVDAGEPRNRYAAHVHGVLGHDDTAPADLLARGRAEVAAYDVEVRA